MVYFEALYFLNTDLWIYRAEALKRSYILLVWWQW